MKTIDTCLLLIISLLFIKCEKDIPVTDNAIVSITTDKLTYSENEKISIEIENISVDTLQLHYLCRGEGYCYIEKIGKMNNNHWVFKDNINLCFWIVLSDYWSKFSPNEIKKDEISFGEPGKYKVTSGFIYRNDTIRISSNEFTVK